MEKLRGRAVRAHFLRVNWLICGLRDFRNTPGWTRIRARLPPALGDNAQGRRTILEAIYLMPRCARSAGSAARK